MSVSPSRRGPGEAVEMQVSVSTGPISAVEDAVDNKRIIFHDREIDALEDSTENLSSTKSSANDAADMRRMGKEQQLVRHFRQLSVASFTALSTCAWELGLFLVSPALINGGRAGLLWSTLWCFIGFGPVYLSMAEMASMAPIAGAQYHWVSEFAPENCQRIMSYLTGWSSTIAWQAGNAMGVFLAGSQIQTMILINNENYAFPNWHGTLLAFASIGIAFVFAVYGARWMPYWQNAVFAVHILGFFAWFVPIWVNAPHASHSQVWTEFSNTGGYPGMALTLLVGQLSGLSNNLGCDTAAHMAEETKDAARAVPKAMIYIYLVNFVIIFPAFVTLCYGMPDLDAALNDSSTYPFVYVLKQSMSTPWITVILALTCCILTCSNIVYLAAVTRDLFAFARDRGFPFSSWLMKVHPTRHVPVNATIVTSLISGAMALIYIGSPLAFYAITSLYVVAILQCYSLSIGCLLWRRLTRPETLPPAAWSLGKWGVPMNAAAVMFSVWAFFWSFWPQEYPVTAAGFNWAAAVFGVVLIGAMGYFAIKGRKQYFGPVVEVEGRRLSALRN